MATIITPGNDIPFKPDDLARLPLPDHVLMVTPDYFDVDYVINPHMEHNVGGVDREQARHQWQEIAHSFKSLGLTTHTLKGKKGLPDMVFSANQSIPYLDKQGIKKVIMSIMYAPQRRSEVPYIEQWYRQAGYEIMHPDSKQISSFEGMGDALWHFDRRLLWGGYGFRTDPAVYNFIAESFNVPVITLELASEYFYHLDTCLNILDEKTALVYKPAFTDASLTMIEAFFERIIVAEEKEAKELFACNVVCPDGKNVIIQKGCDITNGRLAEHGFIMHQVDTSEYLKSGGSVFCMKMLLW